MKENDFFRDGPILNFKRVFTIYDDQRFDLPIRWNGNDFLNEASDLLTCYKETICNIFYNSDSFIDRYASTITEICDGLIETIKEYLNGRESEAYWIFFRVFNCLMEDPLIAFNCEYGKIDNIALFRARKVSENKKYDRKDIFHIPFELRSKISTSRFSIPGYPSLYLSSSAQLCLHELDYDCNPGKYIVSRFEIGKVQRLQILDLGLKPSDFLDYFTRREPAKNPRKKIRQTLLKEIDFSDSNLIKKYLIWYPLIAVCSYMRVNKNDPFAAEYIIPQLLMQALRERKIIQDDLTIGIRYFSCSSVLASDMGFNYVFPTHFSGKPGFCSKLLHSFRLTKPVFINEYATLNDLEFGLKNSSTDFIKE